MSLIIIFAALLLAFFVYFKITKPLNYWKERNVPYEKPWPIVGNLGPVAFRTMSFSDLVHYWCQKNSDKRYFGIFQFFNPTLIITCPELIKEVAIKHFDSFEDHAEFLPAESDPFWSKNLFTMKGQDWRDMRSVLSPAFTSSKIKAMFYIMAECAQKYINSFPNSREIITLDVKESFASFANDVIVSTAFGIQVDTLDEVNNEFLTMGKRALDLDGIKSLKVFGYSISPWLTKVLGVTFFDADVREFFNSVVKKVLKQREESGLVCPDMIHLLREAQKGRLKYDNDANALCGDFGISEEPRLNKNVSLKKRTITDEDIAAQAIVFYIAGFDTVMGLITHAAYELATNPDVQVKLIDEVEEIFRECQGEVTYDALMKMKYLDMVVFETMRLWSAAVVTNRKATKSVVLEVPGTNERLHIEKDTSIWLPIFGLHRDPKIYKNPLKFDPERFSDERKHEIPPSAYIPFGLGPRFCIGNRFALLEAKIILFYILTKFELVPVEKTRIPLRLSKKIITILAEGGYWLGLKPRSPK